MKTAPKRTNKNLRPKHRHTKTYLKHYYPFIPLLVSIGFLAMVLFTPSYQSKVVLSAVTKITLPGLLTASNSERAKVGIQPLKVNPALNKAAQAKANDMVTQNYWSHKTPTGQEPWIFIDNTGFSYQKAGENLAYGFNDSFDAVSGWMNSQSHRENLLDSSFTDVGFGIANSNDFVSNGPETIIVAFYAQSASDPITTTSSTTNSAGHTLGQEKSISKVGLFTGSSWGVYAVGVVLGMSVMYLASVHGNRLRKAVKKGERYVIKHPLLDSAVISLIALGVLLLRSAGYIL